MLKVNDFVKANLVKTAGEFEVLAELLQLKQTDTFRVLKIDDGGYNSGFLGVTEISINGIPYNIKDVDENQWYWAFFTVDQFTETDCFTIVENEEPSFQCETILDISPTTAMCLRAPERSSSDVFKHLIEEVGEYTKTLYRPLECDESSASECADVINTLIDTLWLDYRSKDYFKDVNDTDLMCVMMSELNECIAVKSAKWAKVVGVK
ncbi:hypothetical protein RGZ1_8 [Morganella phage vB_MmoM_Rgz1]|nr:hypothetical protein RGZ1_8 [Morganella phage vB_MmoM_Rgz1]